VPLTSARLDSICEELVAHAITVKGSADNVSVIVIAIFPSDLRSDGEMSAFHQSHNHFAGSKNTFAGVPGLVEADKDWGFGLEEDDLRTLHAATKVGGPFDIDVYFGNGFLNNRRMGLP
jgi:hypothetical protein